MSTLAQPPAPPPPYRTPPAVRRLLAVIAGAVALLLVAGTTVNLLDLASRHTTTERKSFDGVRVLDVAGDGDVRVTGGPAGSPVRIVMRITEGLRSPERRAELDSDGVLQLSSSCPFFAGECRVHYDVRVPPDVQVRADSSAGDVDVEDLESGSPIVLHSSAGDVTATGITAPSVQLDSSAGDVVARGVGSERIRAHSSAGDVQVSVLVPPLTLDADSSAGDVEVVVPDAVYRLDADSSAGDVDAQEVRVDRASRRSIRAHSSAGDVRVDVRGR